MERFLFGFILIGLIGCSGTHNKSVAGQKKWDGNLPIKVVVTTGMIGDLAKNIGGPRLKVEALMGAGVDPHLYKATASDITRLNSADIIFYNGLNLEGKMGDLFVHISRGNPFVIAVTEEIDPKLLLEPPAFLGHYDPHVWFDVTLWAQAAKRIEKALMEFDPKGNDIYQKNGAQLQKKLKELHQWSLKHGKELPKEKRILVTSHDAYNYFGRAYDFNVIGLQGISTVTQAGLADIAKMVDYIMQQKVKAIFIETSVSPKAIQRVQNDAKARGWNVQIGGELFSDAMGKEGTPEGTYEGMVRHNLNTIVEASK